MNKIKIKNSDIVLIIIIVILLITYIFLKIFTYRSEPILLDYAKRKSTNMISSLINKSINEVLLKYNYENIIEIEKDKNGKVENLNINNKDVNEILYLTTDNILNNIELLEKNKLLLYVPIGVIHNIPILVNIGPKIPFKIEILSSTNNDTFTKVKEYGINNALLEVYINISVTERVIIPFKSEKINISVDVPISIKLIQGKIPEYYGGIFSKNSGILSIPTE